MAGGYRTLPVVMWLQKKGDNNRWISQSPWVPFGCSSSGAGPPICSVHVSLPMQVHMAMNCGCARKTVILSLILHTESTSNACVEHRASSAGDRNIFLHRLCGAVPADRVLRDHCGNKSLGDQAGTVQLPQSAGGVRHCGNKSLMTPQPLRASRSLWRQITHCDHQLAPCQLPQVAPDDDDPNGTHCDCEVHLVLSPSF